VDVGLDPKDHALIAMRQWPSATSSPRSAPLRLPPGGDPPNL